MRKISYAIILLLFIGSVNAGVTHPNQVKIAPGEKGEFNFAIDAAIFDVPIKCTIEFKPQTPLDIKFKKTEVELNPGAREFIIGEVKVSKSITPGLYKETFCVSCTRLSNLAGATTRPRYCDLPISVTVSDEFKSTKENPGSINIYLILLILINVILFITIILIYAKKKKSKKDF